MSSDDRTDSANNPNRPRDHSADYPIVKVLPLTLTENRVRLSETYSHPHSVPHRHPEQDAGQYGRQNSRQDSGQNSEQNSGQNFHGTGAIEFAPACSSLHVTLNATGTILAVNSLGMMRLGYGTHLLIGQPVTNLFHMLDRDKLRFRLQQFSADQLHTQLGQFHLVDCENQSMLALVSAQTLWGIGQDGLILLTCEIVEPMLPIASALEAVLDGMNPPVIDDKIQEAEKQIEQLQRLNLELERQIQARTAELELAHSFEATLKRLTDKVRDSLDEAQILQTAVRELACTIGVQSCTASVYDLESRTSTIHYEYAENLSLYLGRVVQMETYSELYDQLLEGQAFQFCSITPNPKRGRVSMLACPIVDDQGIIGDLWLVNQSFYRFGEPDIRLVQQVANQCAIAIRQARLYQTAQAQVQELERLNRLKDDFLSTVSHELRTPMTNIKVATQLLGMVLKQSGVTESNQRADQYFKILQMECQREISLINDLLDLSRLDAGLSPLDLSLVELKPWITAMAQSFIERAQNQEQQLYVEVVADLPDMLTDVSHLERIISELLNNACKYTPAGESITVAAEAIDATRLRLSVTNSGVEIPPLELSRIFEKFYRIPNNDPWQHGGTGLGLALVKGLAELLGGELQVESHQGKTCFWVELPVCLENSASL